MNVFLSVYDYYSRFDGKKFSIGNSFFGLPIFCMVVEKSQYPKIIIQYAMHAREYITTYLALAQIEDFALNGRVGSVYFLPLVNPDGVQIALGKDKLYKANGRGVDLNVNFDARWGKGKGNHYVKGLKNYVGEHPFSEPESKALRDFTLKINPDATISYHSKGEEIYWEFFQQGNLKKVNENLAKSVALTTGYKIKRTPNSCGGYKDWCIEKLKIPALTIEVGKNSIAHPIGLKNLAEIIDKNKGVVDTVTRFFGEKNE